MQELQDADVTTPAAQLMAIELISELLVSTSPRDFGQSLVEQLRELTGARTAMILVHPGRSAQHELLAVSPLRRSALFSAIELDCFCLERTPADLPASPKDFPENHPLRELLERAGVNSILRHPLQAGGELVGLLILLDIPGTERIAELDQIITPLSPIIALAMKNVLAYRQVELQAQELERRVDERTAQLGMKNAELQQSEERLDQLAEKSRVISWEVNSEGLYTFVSHVSEAVIGYTPEELMGKHFYDIHPEEGREEFKKAAFEVFEQKGIFKDLPNPIQAKDNSLIWVSTTGFPLLDSEGNLKGYRGSDTDITDRRLMEESLHLTRFSIEHSSDGFFWMTPDARIVDVNEAACRSLGYSKEELLQLTIFDIDPLYGADLWNHFYVELKQQGTRFFETEHLNKDGERFPVEIVSNLIQFGSKELVCALVRNITDRKQAEAANARFILRQRAILDNLPMMAWLKDTESRLEMVNEPYATACGRSVGECIGKTDMELFPKELAESYIAGDRSVMATGERMEGESLITSPLGLRWHFHSKSPILSEQGQIVGTAGIAHDIHDRKQAEEALSQSEAMFRAVAELSPMAIYSSTGSDQKAKYINDAFYKIFGYSMEDVPTVGDWWIKAYPDEKYRQQVIDKWVYNIEQAQKNNTDVEALECVCTCKDGSEKVIVWVGKTIGDDFWAFGYDNTNRKKAEEEKQLFEQQLYHTQKLESLGVLSGGIAHDFNNILAIIMGYCSLTKMDYETTEQNISEIEKAVERAAGLCRQMLAYAGKAQLAMAQVNMWLLVDEMVNMLKATLPRNAVIKPDLSAQIPYICADESQIRQIVMNLIINASEAIGTEQGEIQVSLSRTTVTDGHAAKDYHGISIPIGEYVCLEVTDTGCGMDEETKWRIFEPFYTTKFSGRGLGMSAVLGIIKSHDGALQLFSQLGQGTTFKVYLPVPLKDSTGDENTSAIPSASWKGSGTILLVEDEDQVRLIAKALLNNFGFTVLEAVNGKEALELYLENAADILLVLTDMGMPVMDGYGLFHELKKLKPELPIIVSSGYGDAEVSSRIGRDNIAGIISKPYNPNQLREVLKRVLENKVTAVE